MYRITFNGKAIYDPHDESLVVFAARAHLSVLGAGSMTIQVPGDHPVLSSITKMKGVLELTDDHEVLFRGRVTKITRGFDKTATIEAEDALA